MKQSQTGVVLKRSGGTTLYEPTDPGPGETMRFLLWNESAPPATIDAEKTWSSQGVPPSLGYYLFLNRIPDPAVLPVFEAAVRKALGPPAATSFAWVSYSAGKEPVISTLLAVKLNASSAPVIAKDVQVKLPAGMAGIGFAADAPVVASTVAGLIDGFEVGYPPLDGMAPSLGHGIKLPIAGDAVGTIRFEGLINAGPPKSQDAALKTLVIAQIDPLRPVDPKRTFQILTGIQYTLIEVGNTYYLVPVGPKK